MARSITALFHCSSFIFPQLAESISRPPPSDLASSPCHPPSATVRVTHQEFQKIIRRNQMIQKILTTIVLVASLLSTRSNAQAVTIVPLSGLCAVNPPRSASGLGAPTIFASNTTRQFAWHGSDNTIYGVSSYGNGASCAKISDLAFLPNGPNFDVGTDPAQAYTSVPQNVVVYTSIYGQINRLTNGSQWSVDFALCHSGDRSTSRRRQASAFCLEHSAKHRLSG